MKDIKEKEKMETGLASLMEGMKGKKVYVELRNDNYVSGYIENCDSYFNMRIRQATVIRSATSQEADEFFVTGRHVRFIHFEHTVDAQAVIRRYLKNCNRPNSKKANRRLDASQSNAGKQSYSA